jgi:hypothetical protein
MGGGSVSGTGKYAERLGEAYRLKRNAFVVEKSNSNFQYHPIK